MVLVIGAFMGGAVFGATIMCVMVAAGRYDDAEERRMRKDYERKISAGNHRYPDRDKEESGQDC